MNDGRRCLGRVFEHGCTFAAVDESGSELGTFPSADAAMAAIRKAAG